ncbi:PRC-barrel domain-containing protein [Pelagovum pacificum]|nr:PRC-barrel domain-containing protein [Pelagovum pacificum]QQA42787.1 PRC-barrel domain-containing protein [Pelagovum pacificum]
MTNIKTLTTATAALVLGFGTAAVAQDMQSGTMNEQQMEDIVRVNELTDAEVFTLEVEADDWDETDYYTEVDSEWDQIGNVTDVAVSRDGQLTGLIVETGGFLDIGDSHVLVSMDNVKLVEMDTTNEGYAYVTNMTEEELQNLENVGENWF